jgi:Fe-S-cluster containining protein
MEALLSPSRPEYVTDLKKIEALSYERAEKNVEFAQFLKAQNPERMDELVKKIAVQVASHIDCTQCANCCKALIVAPDYRDISELASHFQMSTLDFKKKYMKKDLDGDMVMKQKPCPFLKNNKCSVYASRPQLCRNYPYLDKGNVLATLNRTLGNLYVCPIAFNTFELLKLHFV